MDCNTAKFWDIPGAKSKCLPFSTSILFSILWNNCQEKVPISNLHYNCFLPNMSSNIWNFRQWIEFGSWNKSIMYRIQKISQDYCSSCLNWLFMLREDQDLFPLCLVQHKECFRNIVWLLIIKTQWFWWLFLTLTVL